MGENLEFGLLRYYSMLLPAQQSSHRQGLGSERSGKVQFVNSLSAVGRGASGSVTGFPFLHVCSFSFMLSRRTLSDAPGLGQVAVEIIRYACRLRAQNNTITIRWVPSHRGGLRETNRRTGEQLRLPPFPSQEQRSGDEALHS